MAERVLAVISARGGSKSVPRKNLRPLAGKPLIAHTIGSALAACRVDRVIVCTEDDEIAGVAVTCGAEVPFRRPANLATDEVPLIAATVYAVEAMEQLGWAPTVVVQLSPTCPFLPATRIDEAVGLIVDTGSDSAVSLRPITHDHPYRAKELVDGNVIQPFIKDIDVEAFQQRQDLPPLYSTTGGLYARRRALLRGWTGKNFALGTTARAIVLTEIESVNIDGPLDFGFAEFLISQGLAKPGAR